MMNTKDNGQPYEQKLLRSDKVIFSYLVNICVSLITTLIILKLCGRY